MKTRSKPAKKPTKPSKAASKTAPSAPTKAPLERLEAPPSLLVIPKSLSQDARILSLSRPGCEGHSKFYFCPEHGLFELTKLETSRDDYRTLLIAPTPSNEEEHDEQSQSKDPHPSSPPAGFVVPSPTIYTTHPFDPLFLLLPALVESPTKSYNPALFRSAPDIFDHVADELAPHFATLVAHAKTHEVLVRRLGAVCDSVRAGDESMYRLSHEKLLEELLRKARAMVDGGVPGSLEERFVRRVLEVPMMGVRREASSVSEAKVQDADASEPVGARVEGPQGGAPSPETAESQDSTSSSVTATSSTSEATASTALTTPSTSFTDNTQSSTSQPPPQFATPPSIPPLLRLRLAMHSLLPLLPPSLPTHLHPLLTPTFAPLTAHLSALAALRAEIQALRAMNNDILRKRPLDGEDEEKAEERREKKRRKEEEEKRKREMSRGVKALGKVDVSGMKKMGDFFKKKGA